MPQKTTEGRREYRAVEKLTAGEHITIPLHEDADPETWQVVHVAPYRDDNNEHKVAVTLTPVVGGEPELIRHRLGSTVPMATDREVTNAQAGGRRWAFANGLTELARRVLNDRLPIPGFIYMSGITDSREQLDAWAEAFGAEVSMSDRRPVASWKVGSLSMRLQGDQEPEPEPAEVEQEWFFTFGAGQQYDGRFVRLNGTYESTRAVMLQVFGQAWCAQYDRASFDREGLSARLVELPESEWPQTGDQADEDCPDAWHTSPSEPTEPCPACGDSAQPSIDLNRTQAGE